MIEYEGKAAEHLSKGGATILAPLTGATNSQQSRIHHPAGATRSERKRMKYLKGG